MNWISAALEYLYEALFGCHHDRLTRPFTLERKTYKVCLDCGKHVFYSAERMEPLTSRELRRMKKIDSGEVKIFPVPTRGGQLIPASDSESDAAA